MLTLIKREIDDHLIFFVISLASSVILIVTLLYFSENFSETLSIETTSVSGILLGTPFVILVITSLYLMGASQMYTDKNKKISAFLSTRPVSRNQIFLARLISGLIAILILLVPAVVAGQLLLNTYASTLAYPIYPYYTIEIFSSLFLMAVAIYCIGLQSGFYTGKLYHGSGIVSGVALSYILLPLIAIKGYGPQISVILLLFIVASLAYTWKKFIKAPLI